MPSPRATLFPNSTRFRVNANWPCFTAPPWRHGGTACAPLQRISMQGDVSPLRRQSTMTDYYAGRREDTVDPARSQQLLNMVFPIRDACPCEPNAENM
ncbi:uncharacterized protein CLUP02_07135 [Colletotrichum lupini]|uniref:Uncharacterized protein n=1 Tax=Colletotrichum lupini TaxID=145971 RepID=A0A9Q8SQE1_9PEZI|nr:uncharacterized protein CLUP02_07135 [Colletotrichum lupini]UQC81649.1 hypothetical protein CLUP02_07135 [Colletotrichum lupini]